MTTVELSAVEVANLPTEGTFWLVREGERDAKAEAMNHALAVELFTRPDLRWPESSPPAEFTQACAPCECDGSRIDPLHRAVPDRQHLRRACTDCRIELVGPCFDCADDPDYSGEFALICTNCLGDFSVHVGWADAVGQPLPIYHESNEDYDELDPCLLVTVSGRIFYWNPPAGDSSDVSAALAHYGPPESLVGRYALELRQA